MHAGHEEVGHFITKSANEIKTLSNITVVESNKYPSSIFE
jgi:hypothetical protein